MNKKILKKSLIITLIGIIGLSSFTGCGNKEEKIEDVELTTLVAVGTERYNTIFGDGIWTDGENLYACVGLGDSQLVFKNGKWIEENFTHNFESFVNNLTLYDGVNTYYFDWRNDGQAYVLNKTNWEEIEVNTKNVEINIESRFIQTNNNIYLLTQTVHSNERKTYLYKCIFDEKKDNIKLKGFTKITELVEPVGVTCYWTDGENLYYSGLDTHYVLENNEWVVKDWNEFSDIEGYNIWFDGKYAYYSKHEKQYVLNNGKWQEKKWKNEAGESIELASGTFVYRNGSNTYYINDGLVFEFK